MLVLHTHIPCNVVCYVAYFTCVVLCRLPFQQASLADVLRRIQENKTKQNIKNVRSSKWHKSDSFKYKEFTRGSWFFSKNTRPPEEFVMAVSLRGVDLVWWILFRKIVFQTYQIAREKKCMQLDAFHQSRVRISINLSNDILTSLILIAVDVNLVQQHKFLTHKPNWGRKELDLLQADLDFNVVNETTGGWSQTQTHKDAKRKFSVREISLF